MLDVILSAISEFSIFVDGEESSTYQVDLEGRHNPPSLIITLSEEKLVITLDELSAAYFDPATRTFKVRAKVGGSGYFFSVMLKIGSKETNAFEFCSMRYAQAVAISLNASKD